MIKGTTTASCGSLTAPLAAALPIRLPAKILSANELVAGDPSHPTFSKPPKNAIAPRTQFQYNERNLPRVAEHTAVLGVSRHTSG